jgi:hypothetical protein
LTGKFASTVSKIIEGVSLSGEGNIYANPVVWLERHVKPREEIVGGLIYLIGLIVVIMFILSFLGLR